MLQLPGDAPSQAPLLVDVLKDAAAPADVLLAIAEAMPPLALRLASGHLPGDPAAIVGTNDSGDKQKALDVGAHNHMLEALKGKGIRMVLSEEAEEIATVDPDGAFDLAIDPIDGSGSIGIGAPLGLLFAIFPVTGAPFPRAGKDAVAAGYGSFGHSMDFGWSLGDGVHVATFDPIEKAFKVVHQNLMLPEVSKVVAYNASNERHWEPGLQAWFKDILAGKDGPFERNFNMRWLGAAVGDMHRILLQGGMFLYPGDMRPGYEKGRLRLCYEAVPMAFMVEQAGGMATDGHTRILDIEPSDGHEHCPLIFGTTEDVTTIGGYLNDRAKG